MTDILRYFLYGDETPTAEADFLHIEAISLRSGAHDWTIRPHAHPSHLQLLLVTAGGGEIEIEGRSFPVLPPCLIVVPAGSVHGIGFAPGTEGQVITAATAYSRAIAGADPHLAAALAAGAVHPLDAATVKTLGLACAFDALSREFVRALPGRRMAVRAQFERILVALLRLHHRSTADLTPRLRGDLVLLNRYRDLLEDHFRTERRLAFYCDRLGVSLPKLNSCCRARSGLTASKLLHERLIVEAKRNLLYSRGTVAEIAASLGFDDPGYFSRFFSKEVGLAPGAFRRQRDERAAS